MQISIVDMGLFIRDFELSGKSDYPYSDKGEITPDVLRPLPRTKYAFFPLATSISH